jgi:hypothetical protein
MGIIDIPSRNSGPPSSCDACIICLTILGGLGLICFAVAADVIKENNDTNKSIIELVSIFGGVFILPIIGAFIYKICSSINQNSSRDNENDLYVSLHGAPGSLRV